jgi:hypothetical protein
MEKPAAYFTSFDWIRVEGKGDVAMILCDRDRPDGMKTITGETVDIDGGLYAVLDVLSPASAASVKAGEHVRLLVTPKHRL